MCLLNKDDKLVGENIITQASFKVACLSATSKMKLKLILKQYSVFLV